MYIETTWIFIWIVVISFVAYRIGRYFGDMTGYNRYDAEIGQMEKDGDVVFPNKITDEEIDAQI